MFLREETNGRGVLSGRRRLIACVTRKKSFSTSTHIFHDSLGRIVQLLQSASKCRTHGIESLGEEPAKCMFHSLPKV